MRLSLLLLLVVWSAAPAFTQATLSGIAINEILADPNSSTNNFDTDGDGTAETNDEFVELYNTTGSPVDISGWQIYDDNDLAHTFAMGTVLAANGYIAVVADWDPGTPPTGIVAASEGSLGFGNGGDSVHLYNPSTDTYIVARYNGDTDTPGDLTGSTNGGDDDFGSDTDGQSIQRTPDGSTSFASAVPTPAAANGGGVVTTTVRFAASTGSAGEGDGTTTLTVSISNPDASAATSVEVALTSGDATDLASYMTQTVTFPANSSDDETVTVTITDDMDVEGSELFTFTLQNVSGGMSAALGSPSSFDLTILDNDAATGGFDVVINEILADPNSSTNNFDTDGDGTAETNDEFVELYNNGSSAVDISSWEIYDGGSFGHAFTAGTVLNPGDFIVVVGDWDPGTPPAGVVEASDGSLNFTNGGDSVFLYNPSSGEYIVARYNGNTAAFPGPAATLVGETDFGSDTDGQSLQRAPDGSATIVSATPNPGGVNVPVELVAFDVTLDGTVARLAWATASETNNAGFEVQVRGSQDAAFGVLGFVEGRGTTTEAQTYAFRTDALPPGTYTFRLKQLDFDGAFEYSPEVETTVTLTEAFALSDTYPNPFTGVTRLSLSVQQPQAVVVTVYDALGRTVATLHDGPMTPEAPAAMTLDGRTLASGLYVVRVVGETFATTRRVTLVR
ncbi:MAG: lamin tail domain-containing protein [Bacteroidota bacterium]